MFADPRGRENLPLAQDYRRYARGFLFAIDFGDSFRQMRGSWKTNDGRDLWRHHRDAAIETAIASMSFLASRNFMLMKVRSNAVLR